MGYKDSLTLALTRITIGIQVFFAGVALPKKYLKLQFQSLVVLLLPIMAIAWLVCGFLIYELIPGLTFMEALLISACITPTDPVLANSITKGRYAEESVSPGVRDIIVAESGANDGLGYPFIFLRFLGLIGSDDLLCCFIAGNSFSWDDRQRIAAEDAGFQDIIDMLLNAYKAIPAISSLKEAIFIGWFGPIGVSAIFYVQVALEYLPKDSRDQVKKTVEPIVYFMVFTSVLVHGITVPASKVLMRGVTLTRTLTQSGLSGPDKRVSHDVGPVTVDDIRRIGVAIPLPVYHSETGRRMSSGSSPEPTVAGDQAPPGRDRETGTEGRTVMFRTPSQPPV
ncbi:Na(+)/H(+) antiporter [Rhizoctonia solani AG-1 IB]|uniref:Na(+)/H(+) antiporter n=1 Tax=Thanatephorus cucumeris (strain AG1-IB / isolate 7/3/14) TaxID=1108050 RepID=M5BPG7_THACB|nr:Na(+)/H(+) antiporter [Rhizoctonia solani AG-1 IB]